jgi:hypothetical protein
MSSGAGGSIGSGSGPGSGSGSGSGSGPGSGSGSNLNSFTIYSIINKDTDNLANYLDNYMGKKIYESGISLNYRTAEAHGTVYQSNVFRFLTDGNHISYKVGSKITSDMVDHIRNLNLDMNVPNA